MKNNVFRKKNMLPHNSLVAQMVKNLFSMWMTEVQSLGRGRSLGEGKDYLLQYSGLDNCMDCMVHGVVKSQTQLSNFHSREFGGGEVPCQADSILVQTKVERHS